MGVLVKKNNLFFQAKNAEKKGKKQGLNLDLFVGV